MGGEVVANRRGERLVEVGGDVDFGHPGVHRPGEVGVRHPGRSTQDIVEASYMTEPNPSATASCTRATSVAWSRCTATWMVDSRATANVASANGSNAPW